jgi:endonuclease III
VRSGLKSDGKPVIHNLPEDVEAYRRAHIFLLALGKYFCKAKPDCEKCPVGDLCSVLGEEK